MRPRWLGGRTVTDSEGFPRNVPEADGVGYEGDEIEKSAEDRLVDKGCGQSWRGQEGEVFPRAAETFATRTGQEGRPAVEDETQPRRAVQLRVLQKREGPLERERGQPVHLRGELLGQGNAARDPLRTARTRFTICRRGSLTTKVTKSPASEGGLSMAGAVSSAEQRVATAARENGGRTRARGGRESRPQSPRSICGRRSPTQQPRRRLCGATEGSKEMRGQSTELRAVEAREARRARTGSRGEGEQARPVMPDESTHVREAVQASEGRAGRESAPEPPPICGRPQPGRASAIFSLPRACMGLSLELAWE